MQAVLRVGMIVFLASSLVAQTATTTKKEAAESRDADVQALKDAVSAQQEQIKALSQQLQQTNEQLQQTRQLFQQTQQQIQPVNNAAPNNAVVNNAALKNAVLENTVLSPQDPPQTNAPEPQQVFNKEMESAITIRFRGINITPGGFAAAEFVRRSRALGADVSTPFNSLTMPGASQSSVPEFFGSARQSRPTVYVEGRVGNVDLSSYVSGDFLSAGVTSTSTSTNGYTFRLRQVWGQAKFDNGWSFLGGQMWSLVTENVKGIAPADDIGKTNDARPKTIDSSYNVGFTYARQYGIRLTKKLGDTVAIAVALENPQATLTTHGNASNFLVGEVGDGKSYNSTYNYSFNPSPDIIAKIAFDPGFGHYEIFGLYDRFTGRVFPCVENFASPACGFLTAASATLAYNASKNGGGVGASARWNFANKHVVCGVKGFGGSGIGRYASGGLSDASINADGTIHLIKNYQGLGTLEWHGKKLDIYTYGGAEYAARTFNFDPTLNKGVGANVGYGAPTFANIGCYSEAVPGSGGFTPGTLASCTGDTRVLFEGTAGFWYRFYSGPRGRFQYGTQFSYVSRNTWSGAGGLPASSAGRSPNGLDGMVFTSFRYYLP